MYIVITTYAKMKSGGTGSFWYGTQDKEMSQEKVDFMIENFPQIDSIHNISIMSEKMTDGIRDYFAHYRIENNQFIDKSDIL